MAAETIFGWLALGALKASLVLASAWVGLALLARLSASVRHWLCAIALGCTLIIPALGLITPTWTIPILPADTHSVGDSPNSSALVSTRHSDGQRSALQFNAKAASATGSAGSIKPAYTSTVPVANVLSPPSLVSTASSAAPPTNWYGVALII